MLNLIKNEKWKNFLEPIFNQDFYATLCEKYAKECEKNSVYPPKSLLFEAFNKCPFDKTCVVIFGQDPYHTPKLANGLAFSVNKGFKLPPSLKNIYKELSNNCGCLPPEIGDLTPWARQGVLLLNTRLSVEKNKPLSHKNLGWEEFCKEVILALCKEFPRLIFVLWGNEAKAYQKLLGPQNIALCASHPSPFSVRGFLGCKHFTKINEELIKQGKSPIYWELEKALF